jgi:hypothetical protein
MAIVLKENKTFNPDISDRFGVDMTNNTYYGAIDIIDYDKGQKQCNFTVDVYGTKSSREDGGIVVHRFNFNFTDNAFDIQIGNGGISVEQAYNKALETLTDWESDEV